MTTVLKGIYCHTKTNNLYKVLGTGRSVENPHKQVVVYEQIGESKLRDTNILLPNGSLWTRDLDDFNSYDGNVKKFTKYDPFG